jgi:hypothetical protein
MICSLTCVCGVSPSGPLKVRTHAHEQIPVFRFKSVVMLVHHHARSASCCWLVGLVVLAKSPGKQVQTVWQNPPVSKSKFVIPSRRLLYRVIGCYTESFNLTWLDLAWLDLNWIELNWIELNWIELDWIELSWNRLNWIELNWIELDWIGLNWVEIDWTELNWIELNWIELNWIELNCIELNTASSQIGTI